MSLAKFDQQYCRDKIQYLAGVDEAGRGPLAGPVVAAAVILPLGYDLETIRDSKKLSEKKRSFIYSEIVDVSVSIGIGIIHEKEIDKINILQATYKAMKMALGKLKQYPEKVLIDGLKGDIKHYNCNYIIDGDNKSQSIAAASIIAKVTRDRIMLEYDKIYPDYGFAKHKGYGTKYHLEIIKEKKATVIHRKSFNPIKPNLPKLSFFDTNEKLINLSQQLAATGIVKKEYKILGLNIFIENLGKINIIHRESDVIVFTRVNTISKEIIFDNSINKTETIPKDVLLNIAKTYTDKKGFDVKVRFDVISVSFSGSKPQILRNNGKLKNY